MNPTPIVVWFARGAGIKRAGPYATQVEAVAAMRATDGDPVKGCFVWPEVVAPPKKKQKVCK